MEETIKTFDRLLSLGGITFYAKHNWRSKMMLCYQIWNVIISIITIIFISVFALVNATDTLLLIDTAAVWTTGVIMSISLSVCLFFRDEFRSFLIEMGFNDGMLEMPFIKYVLKRNRHRQGKLGELKYLVEESQRKLLMYTRIALKVYIASVFVSATLYILGPVYLMFVRGDESLRLLAFNMWFPWSLKNFKVYVASFIYHVYAGYLCCIAYPGLQLTIALLVGQTIRQLHILTFIFENMSELVSGLVATKNEQWHAYSHLILKQSIDHYVKIKRFSNRLNLICQPFYLVLILASVMLVCVCSVKIAISDKLAPDTFKFYLHGFCFVVEVLVFCLLGQQVDNEVFGCLPWALFTYRKTVSSPRIYMWSQELEAAVTNKWYEFDSRYRNNLVIFQQALSPKMPIYIFGSIKLELPTFTWFIQTEMAFFTLIMSVFEED